MKNLKIIVLLSVLIIASLFFLSCNTGTSNNSYKTPEAAIEHFVKAVKNNDLESTLEVCAINEISENYDFIGHANRIEIVMPWEFYAPSKYQMYVEMNRIGVKARIVGQLKLFIYSFFITEGLDGRSVVIESDNQASDFVSVVDPKKLSKLTLEKIDVPRKDLMYSDINVENFTKAAKIYGADETTERVVLYKLDGEYYWGGFQLMKYKDYWKITGLVSVLAGQPPFGTVVKTTPQEFERILK